MGFFSWIVVGLIAGALARWVLPGEQKMGIIWTMLAGIVGGFLAGWVLSLFGVGTMDGVNLWSILAAAVGAIVVILVVKAIKK